MADTSGDQFTVRASETLTNVIFKIGKTNNIDHVGKALEVVASNTEAGQGVKIAGASTTKEAFGGIAFAVSGEVQTNLDSKVPYFYGDYTVPKGKYLTMARNCRIHVIGDANIKSGDPLKLAANGAFTTAASADSAKVVGRAYSLPKAVSNNDGTTTYVIDAYIGAY